MTDLIIVESPKKAKTISKMLGSNYIVRASVGHIRDLPEKEIGVNAPDYKPKYVITKRGGDVIKELKSIVPKVNKVYLAADADREGESIAWHLQSVLGLKDNYHRITYNEITKTAIDDALKNPRKLDLKLVASQEARRVLDRLVGYRVSPYLREKTGINLPAGRVQSNAVKLVVLREKEINEFKSIDYYTIAANFKNWKARLDIKTVINDGKYLTDFNLANEVKNSINVLNVVMVDESEKNIKPKSPFKTSQLQRASFNKFSFDSDRTMKIAQSLYEKGLISYHRTDSINISDEAYLMVKEYCIKNNMNYSDKKNKWKEKEDSQQAHEAIRPSSLDNDISDLSEDEKLIYNLIWVRFVSSQMNDAKAFVKKVVLQSNEYQFIANGQTITYKGWKELLSNDDLEEEKEKLEILPDLKEGQSFNLNDDFEINLESKKTNPPTRYSQASLTELMENLGIGRPSTFASIMNKIIDHGYIEEKMKGKKKYLFATDKAFHLYNSLEGNFDFFDLDYTKEMEIQLDKISKGSARYREVLSILDGHIDNSIEKSQIKSIYNFECKSCGSMLKRYKSKDKKSYWWGCSSYPDCKQTYKDCNDKPLYD